MGDTPERSVTVVAGAEPVKLGSMLFTIVEPHRGHEVAYNRWYERDHLYSGCMIGPYNFAARRFVATADLKALRDPDPSAITGAPLTGSYLAMYWILAGNGGVWGKWAGYQVHALHEAGRMFEERDHVHTQLYNYCWERSRDTDGVPAELALDHPYQGVICEFLDAADGYGDEDLDGWLRDEHLPSVMQATPAGLVLGFRPQPMRADAPGVARREAESGRILLLWFLDQNPGDAWVSVTKAHRSALGAAGRARVVAALPFIPTVPGTDTYTDRLWAD